MQATNPQLLDVTALLNDPRLTGSGRVQRHAFYELVYIRHGEYRVETLGVTWQGRPGWLYCYAPGQAHRGGFVTGAGRPVPEGILVQWTEPATTKSTYPPAYYDVSRRWQHLLMWLLDLFTSGHPDDRRAANQLLPALLRELTRAATRAPALLPAVNVYLHDHRGEPIRMEQLAATLGMSRSHFSRTFRRLTGQTPQQYVLRSRLDRARALLAEPGATVANVARRCGFSSSAHLAHLFRGHFQTTPRAVAAQAGRNRSRLRS